MILMLNDLRDFKVIYTDLKIVQLLKETIKWSHRNWQQNNKRIIPVKGKRIHCTMESDDEQNSFEKY